MYHCEWCPSIAATCGCRQTRGRLRPTEGRQYRRIDISVCAALRITSVAFATSPRSAVISPRSSRLVAALGSFEGSRWRSTVAENGPCGATQSRAYCARISGGGPASRPLRVRFLCGIVGCHAVSARRHVDCGSVRHIAQKAGLVPERHNVRALPPYADTS